jgi:hypothetical protein
MRPRFIRTLPHSFLAAAYLALAFLFGCSSNAKSTAIRTERNAEQAENYKADEFIGTPIVGDYNNNDNSLDFVLGVTDGDRTFKINVHEDVNESNREAINTVRERINEMEDRGKVRVIGYYSSEYKGQSKEYGFLQLKCIVFFDDKTGYEEAYFTDPKDSRFYTEGDVTVIYAPGHHYRHVYYPRYCSPWWDSDMDGIPDRYDPWPYSYDIWYDNNLNGIPDWYDPFYCDYYPYWNNWDMGLWVNYGWYSPGYFRHGYDNYGYYDDYRIYSRLYDRQYVNRRGGAGYSILDPKTEWRYRQFYGDAPRAGYTNPARATTGYDPRAMDRRRLAPVLYSSSGSLDARNSSGAGYEPARDFTRNRVTEGDGAGDSRVRATRQSLPVDENFKRKADPSSGASSGSYTPRATYDRSRGSVSGGAGQSADRASTYDRSRSTGAGGDSRSYVPAARNGTGDNGSGTSSSGSTVNTNSGRSRDSGRLTSPSSSSGSGERSRGETRARGSSGASSPSYTPPPSSGGRSREVSRPSSGGSAPRSNPAPSAAPSSGSRGGSYSPPPSSSNQGSSRGRDSSSSSSSGSSRGGSRRR